MARVLLHACCAPCSAAILEWMMANGVQPYIYYCNPNITPQEEYEHRRDELKRYAERLGVPFEEAPYDHEAWLEAVRGLEDEPERGKRCLQCFRYRLMQSARRAQELGIGTFTTSLASSRWKSLAQTTEAGNEAAAEVSREGEQSAGRESPSLLMRATGARAGCRSDGTSSCARCSSTTSSGAAANSQEEKKKRKTPNTGAGRRCCCRCG